MQNAKSECHAVQVPWRRWNCLALGQLRPPERKANVLLGQRRQRLSRLATKCRDSKASRHVASICRWPILPFVSCKMFSRSARFVEYNEFEEEDSPEDRAGAASDKDNPAIVWMSSAFRVVTSSIIASSKNVTYHCTKAGEELVPAKCGIIRHSCRKKHLNLQNQTMTVLQIHLPLTHPVPLGPSHIPLVMQRCSRNEYCAGRTTFWYPQQRNPFPETPNTKVHRCWDKSLNHL